MTVPRRLALMIVIIILSSTAASARAGEYPVYACHPGAANVNNSWSPVSNHGGMLAYANCAGASSPSWNLGLVTRPSTVPGNPGATVPNGALAGMAFHAPPGTRLSRMSYTQEWCGNGAFRSGVVNASSSWLRWGTVGFCHLVDQPSYTLNLGGTTVARIQTQCVAGPCNVGGTALPAWATTRSVVMYVSDSSRPTVRFTGGSALSGGWIRGNVDVTVAASDNVGITAVAVRLGDQVEVERTFCNYTLRVPCPNATRRFVLNTRSVPDGARTLTLGTWDTPGNASEALRQVHVDNTPPAAPSPLRSAEGMRWSADNRFSLSWRNPVEPGRAAVAGAYIGVCPAANPPEDWAGCQGRTAIGVDRTSIDDLSVPHAGRWTARVWLVDAAGNADRRLFSEVPLLFDDAPPRVSLAEPSPDDPSRIVVTAVDATSPLATAEVEYRRRGTRTWTALPVTRTTAGFVARMDDEHLANGVYDIRARAVDSAGNEQSTSRFASGAAAQMRVPMRIDTRLVAGESRVRRGGRSRGRAPRRRRVIEVSPRVGYGRPVPIVGRLTTPGGNPVAGASIEVWRRVSRPGAGWRRVALVGTSGSGRFTYRALRGPSRVLRFRYAGSRLVRARSSEVTIAVRAGATLRASRSNVVNGGEVRFSGKVLGRYLPATGKLVKLQAYSRGAWRTFATPRASARTGRWTHRYRFTATRGTVRYRFRAEVPREAAFPYARGASRQVIVRVRGL